MGSKKVDPNVGIAQRETADIARQQEQRAADNDAFFRENFAPRYLQQMDDSLSLARDESERQQGLADYSLELSKKYDQRYWDTTAKQQDAFYRIVDDYDTVDAQEREATRASADVAQGMDVARASTARNMQRMGINPASAGYTSAMADMAMNEGLARAGAANMAREAARREGLNLRATAAGLGGNLTGASSGYLGQSGGMGVSAVNTMGTGMQAINAANGGFAANNAAWNNGMSAAAGSWNTVGNLGLGITRAGGNRFNLGGAISGAAMGYLKTGNPWGAALGGLGGGLGG